MSFYAYVKQPDDETIWHYLDFTRFALLLDQRALFFDRADQIDVQLEGYGSIGQVIPGTLNSELHSPLNEFAALSRVCLAISCWYMHDGESAALWKQHPHASIALQSTVPCLKKGLNYNVLKYVKIGAVNYGPPAIHPDETGVSIEVDYFYKRPSFQHEREIRILGHARDHAVMTHNHGILIPATLETLVTEIHVAPTERPWFVDLIRSMIRDTYHLEIPVVQTSVHEMTIL